jgi:hypothetical protein
VADTVTVVFAVYGALADGWFDEQAESVRRMYTRAGPVQEKLQTLLDRTPNNVVTINTANVMGGDPAPGFVKHFGAIVEYKEERRAYACQEGQTIDFSQQTARLESDPATVTATGTVTVLYAVYGALDGNQVARAQDVKKALQTLLNQTLPDGTPNNVVTIDNANMGGDPAVGLVKHFGAYVEVGRPGQPGTTIYFACQEGQKIDFSGIYGPVLERGAAPPPTGPSVRT